MRKLSLCITTYQRVDFTLRCFKDVLDDPYVDEIVISDDHSDIEIFEQLQDAVKDMPKVKLYRNEVNIDCYKNKAKAVSLASNPWVILFDSDNIITKDYITKIYEHQWVETIILAPVWAMPTFDYRDYEGLYINQWNVAKYIDMPMFSTALNTHNMFVNRDEYLSCFDATVDPNTSDSIFMNTRWIEKGNTIYFVPELYYEHEVHEQSHYRLNSYKGDMNNNLLEKLRNME